MTIPACPKCGGEMQEGFLLELRYGTPMAQRWVVGAPEVSFFGGVRLKGKPQHEVQTFRCSKCGFLESYANGPAVS